jgi:hypothetical protein
VNQRAPLFTGRVDEAGKLRATDRPGLERYLVTLAGLDVDIIVRRHVEQRTLDQNAYWWTVPVRLLADHCGYSDVDMHYALLGECFGWKAGPTGKEIPNVTSSSALKVDEFSRLIDWVLVWGPTEMNCIIPPPTEVA